MASSTCVILIFVFIIGVVITSCVIAKKNGENFSTMGLGGYHFPSWAACIRKVGRSDPAKTLGSKYAGKAYCENKLSELVKNDRYNTKGSCDGSRVYSDDISVADAKCRIKHGANNLQARSICMAQNEVLEQCKQNCCYSSDEMCVSNCQSKLKWNYMSGIPGGWTRGL